MIELMDGRQVRAMILDLDRVRQDEIEDITEIGSWRGYLTRRGLAAPPAHTS